MRAALIRRKNKQISPIIDIDDLEFSNKINDTVSICLVTDEIANVGPSGGIGASFAELSRLLANTKNYKITIFYTNFHAAQSPDIKTKLIEFAEGINCNLTILNPSDFTDNFSVQNLSYALMKQLKLLSKNKLAGTWDIVHFHDYKGLGFFTALHNKQSPRSISKKIIVQTHGPSRWAVEANGKFFSHEDQLIMDYMEKNMINLCDHVVSPSDYLIEWMKDRKWLLASESSCPHLTIPNLRTELPCCSDKNPPSVSSSLAADLNEIIFFGRHEGRKGLKTFIDAISLLNKNTPVDTLNVTILGGLGDIGETPSLLFLENATKGWINVNLKLITNFNRNEALQYLRDSSATKLVCICSLYENSPYTVVEAAQCGCRLILSNQGGGKELIKEDDFWGYIDMTTPKLATAIQTAINNPIKFIPTLAKSDQKIEEEWLEFHNFLLNDMLSPEEQISQALSGKNFPLVTFAITHYNRPHKLLEAVYSVLLQRYPNIELVIVDDGTTDEEALKLLKNSVEPLVKMAKGKLIYRENGYLGAARNTALLNSSAEYIIFMDDDDIALPELVENLMEAMLNKPCDALIPLNAYMPIQDRKVLIKERFKSTPRPSYIPLGPIKSLTPFHNYLGASTSLMKVSALKQIGGYTEERDIGHEDYEVYVRFVRSGFKVEVLPEVLYLYETQRPSMISNTTIWKNFRRSIEAHGLPPEIEDLIFTMKGKKIDEMRASRIKWIHSDSSFEELFTFWPSRKQSVEWMLRRLSLNNPGSELIKGITRGIEEKPL